MAAYSPSLVAYINSVISIPQEAAIAIAAAFEERDWKKGEVLLREGKISDEYLLLEQGFLRSFLYDTEGNEVTVNFYPAHTMVFEVASFFQRVPSQETIEALSDGSGWKISYQKLNALFHAVPEFRELGRAVLVKGFIAFKARTISLINKTAEQRYELLLQTNPEIIQRAPLKYIASYLGVTDTSLSRIRKDFSKK